MTKRKRAQKERQACPSSCIACEAAATGYHYEAPSCTSCKTFFRRTVLQERVYLTCFMNGMCAKDDSFRPCRACRFDRCVAGGMNPLLIISLKNPEANPVVQRVFQKRAFDESESSTSTAIVQSSPRELVIVAKRVTNPSVLECTIDRIIGGLLYLENAHQELRAIPTFDPRPSHGYRLDGVVVGPSLFSKTTLDAHTPPCDPVIASKKDKVVMRGVPTAKKLWPFVDLFISIEYLKTFQFFHYLKHEEKKALVRHVAIMCSQLTLAYFSYENKSGITLHPDGSIPHDGYVPLHKEHERQLHHGIIQILRLLEMDKKEYVLLKALVVCNPAIEHLYVSHKEELERERLKYSRSLMSYVLSRRGHEKGPAAYTAMMTVIDTLTHLMKKHKNWRILQDALQYQPGMVQTPSLTSDIYDY
ncbi:hypothetical protein PENTCL1PPCAC_17122 [Pristionchus entomophagus]|uniref:Nuclear receptor n=1 Tax=Pristionchus entomophagus TaxID=358040 RepID=A0AAV5TKK5_9BILA|nr:hypothetical protein PENTCL1PPCAC_17122 [Pristionchus entomophagus]